jgi:hypothetical protein
MLRLLLLVLQGFHILLLTESRDSPGLTDYHYYLETGILRLLLLLLLGFAYTITIIITTAIITTAAGRCKNHIGTELRNYM